MNKIRKSKCGQTMTEYIIILAVVAVAALAIFGLFGDRLRRMVGGAIVELGGDESEVNERVSTDSADFLKSLDSGGGH